MQAPVVVVAVARVAVPIAVVPPSRGYASTQHCRHGSPTVCGTCHVEDMVVSLEYGNV